MVIVSWSRTLTSLINAHPIETLLIVKKDERLQLLVAQPIEEVDVDVVLVRVTLLSPVTAANRRLRLSLVSDFLNFTFEALLSF